MPASTAMSPYQIVHALLLSSLSGPELRQLVLFIGDEEAHAALPGDGATDRELAVQAVLVLSRRSLLDQALVALEQLRPARAVEIQRVRASVATLTVIPPIVERFDECLGRNHREGVADLLVEHPAVLARLFAVPGQRGIAMVVDGGPACASLMLSFVSTQQTVRGTDVAYFAFADVIASPLGEDGQWTPQVATTVDLMKRTLIAPKIAADGVARGFVLAGRRGLLSSEHRDTLRRNGPSLWQHHLEVHTYDWLRDRLVG